MRSRRLSAALAALSLLAPATAAAHPPGDPLGIETLFARIEAGEVREALVFRDDNQTDVRLENGAWFTTSYGPEVERVVLERLRAKDADFEVFGNRDDHEPGSSTLVIVLVLSGLTVGALALHQLLVRRRPRAAAG